ncbi:Gfo/Idh/MocA family protein [Rhodoferax sp.]|uniref:Gfo/Idh/MocA family protein n=1 Tax=Rhodoferax sp. TaxID=50421 RepID=UPI00374D99A0
MTQLKIAVAGAGIIGLAHIEVLQKSPRCTLSAIVDLSPGAVAIAARAGVPLYTSLEALLAASKPDGIILATPNHLHVPQALQCIAAGLPVLLEKPVAPTLAEGEQLVKVVEETGARLLIGHHRAHSPIMAKAKEVVDSGRLGKLVTVMGSAQFFKPDDYFAAGPWRTQPGGGPILINLIHEVHNLRMLCGEITAVQAFASNTTRGFAVEDTVAINLRFASGVLGSFMLSDTAACPRSWEQTSQENKAYTTYTDEDCYVIAGTDGSLSVPTMRLKTYPRPEDRSWWKEFESGVVGMVRDDPLKHQMHHFADVIEGQAPPLVSARDGLQNLRVTEAIAEAAKTGLVVPV